MSFAKLAAIFTVGWLGLQWFGDAVSAEALEDEVAEGFTRRHLLQSNPPSLQLSQQQVDPNTIYHFPFDPDQVFGEPVILNTVDANLTSGPSLPSWMLFDPKIDRLSSTNIEINGGVDVVGNIAYLSAADFGLQILNITDLEKPVFLSKTAGYRGGRFTVNKGIAYVVDTLVGIHIFNVTDSFNPTFITTHALTDQTEDIASEGDFISVANNVNGWCVSSLRIR